MRIVNRNRFSLLGYWVIGLLGYFVLTLTIPKPAHAQLLSCGFETIPYSPFDTSVEKLIVKFTNTDEIKSQMRQFDLLPGNTVKFKYPSGTCPDITMGQITSIDNIPVFTLTYEKGSLSGCYNTLLSQNERVQLMYQDIPICEGGWEVLDQETSCKLDVSLGSGTGDILSTWNIKVSNIKFDPKYTSLVIKDNGKIIHSEFTDFLPDPYETTLGPLEGSEDHTIEIVAAGAQVDAAGKVTGFTDGPVCASKTFPVAKLGDTGHCDDRDVGGNLLCTEISCNDDPSNQCNICPVCVLKPKPVSAICNELLPNGQKRCEVSCSDGCEACPGCEPAFQPLPKLKPLCDQIDEDFQGACRKCVVGSSGIWTAIGCLPTDFSVIIRDYVFPYGLGIAGGVAFLYFLYGAFLILTSTGNPEVIAQGKQIITSALSGLFLIIFSVFFLKVIGVDILKLPGFSGG